MTIFDEDKRDLVSCQVKNSNLHEDLAQIDYMFCDKTGTLTQNELIFKAFKIVGGTADLTTSELKNIQSEHENIDSPMERPNPTRLRESFLPQILVPAGNARGVTVASDRSDSNLKIKTELIGQDQNKNVDQK